MNELKDEIEEARDRVAHCRLRAERPGARLEDEYALEKARTRLLTLELRSLRSELKSANTAEKHGNRRGAGSMPKKSGQSGAVIGSIMRTKHKQLQLTARERAEASFAALKKGPGQNMEDR